VSAIEGLGERNVPDLRTTASLALNLVRNAPVAASIAARRFSSDPSATAVRLAERLPASVLQRGRRRPEIELLLGGEATLDDARDADAGTLRRMIGIATALNRTELAHELLTVLPEDDSARARLTARLDWKKGLLTQARDELSETTSTPWRDDRLRASFDDELKSLEPGSGASRHLRTTTPLQPLPGRVLHLVTNSLPHANAGYTTRTHQILTAQNAIGLDPHALTRLGFPVAQGVLTAAHLDVIDGIPYHRSLPLRPLPLRATALLDREIEAASSIAQQVRPGVLHAASNHWNGQVALALRERHGVPVVYEVRGFLEESWLSRREGDDLDGSSTDRYRLERALETHVMSEADLVTTLGEVMRHEIIERGIEPSRVVVAPNAVDQRFLQTTGDATALRASLGITPDEVTVGVVSTLYKHEGIETLIDAVALLVADGAPVRLLIVGEGPEREALQQRIEAVGLTGRTVMTGRVPFDQVHRYYEAVDIFCVPRIRARVSDLVTPLKPVEAMATRRPVVASDVGGLREVITDGVTGLLVPPDDAVALAGAVGRLLYDPDLRGGYGEAARTWVAEHRTWEQVAHQYRDAYARLGAQ